MLLSSSWQASFCWPIVQKPCNPEVPLMQGDALVELCIVEAEHAVVFAGAHGAHDIEPLIAGVMCNLFGAFHKGTAQALVLGCSIGPAEMCCLSIDMHLADHGFAWTSWQSSCIYSEDAFCHRA